MSRFYSTNIANFGSSYVLKNTNKNPRQTQHLTTSAATAWRIQPTQRRPAALWKADDVCYQIVIRLLGYIRLPLLLYPTEVPTWLFFESSASFFRVTCVARFSPIFLAASLIINLVQSAASCGFYISRNQYNFDRDS